MHQTFNQHLTNHVNINESPVWYDKLYIMIIHKAHIACIAGTLTPGLNQMTDIQLTAFLIHAVKRMVTDNAIPHDF